MTLPHSLTLPHPPHTSVHAGPSCSEAVLGACRSSGSPLALVMYGTAWPKSCECWRQLFRCECVGMGGTDCVKVWGWACGMRGVAPHNNWVRFYPYILPCILPGCNKAPAWPALSPSSPPVFRQSLQVPHIKTPNSKWTHPSGWSLSCMKCLVGTKLDPSHFLPPCVHPRPFVPLSAGNRWRCPTSRPQAASGRGMASRGSRW